MYKSSYRYRTSMPTFCALFALLCWAGYSAGIVFWFYAVAKNVNELRHIQPSNCTILDAQVTSGDDTTEWIIHVNFTVPPSYHQPPNTTAVALLQGTDIRKHYAVNETLPCFASTKSLDTVSLSRRAADGGTIFAIFSLCLMCIPILIGPFIMYRSWWF